MTPEAQIARMKVRAAERYGLETVPGRPEELIKPGTERGVSFAYSGGEVRVRPMYGRDWIDAKVTDFKNRAGWADQFYRLLDEHFGGPYGDLEPSELDPLYTPPTSTPLADYLRSVGSRPRPIRDNPQA